GPVVEDPAADAEDHRPVPEDDPLECRLVAALDEPPEEVGVGNVPRVLAGEAVGDGGGGPGGSGHRRPSRPQGIRRADSTAIVPQAPLGCARFSATWRVLPQSPCPPTGSACTPRTALADPRLRRVGPPTAHTPPANSRVSSAAGISLHPLAFCPAHSG